MYLAKQLKLSRSSSPSLSYSIGVRSSPKLTEKQEGVLSPADIPTASYAPDGLPPSHIASRITYKCGHQLADTFSFRSKSGHFPDKYLQGSSGSASQPHLTDCETLYHETSSHQRRQAKSHHSQPQSRSLSVGPASRHPRLKGNIG